MYGDVVVRVENPDAVLVTVSATFTASEWTELIKRIPQDNLLGYSPWIRLRNAVEGGVNQLRERSVMNSREQPEDRP